MAGIKRPDGKKRPSWDEYFMSIAELVATRSTCVRRHVGAVLVRDRKILATGYNGAPSSIEHCDRTGCLRAKMSVPSGERHELCRGLHAEQNAFLQAALHGTSVKGAVLYSTIHPCIICAKMIINAGIKAVVIADSYPDSMSAGFLREARVRVRVTNPRRAPRTKP
ncbi:MAG: cytidine/deoxycytidylate deaminase family protein [Candidatus Omnitrophota bacterium]